MKVILTMDIKGVGKRGEVKEVATGFWQNFLQPRGLAVLPNTPEALKIAAQLKAKQDNQDSDLLRIKNLAQELDGKIITITAKANRNKLFGAIRETEVAEKLGIDRNQIKMKPIKAVGTHVVKLELPQGIQATITVEIVPE